MATVPNSWFIHQHLPHALTTDNSKRSVTCSNKASQIQHKMFTFYRIFGVEPTCDKMCFWRMKTVSCNQSNCFGWLNVWNKSPLACFDVSLLDLVAKSLAVFLKHSLLIYHLEFLYRITTDFVLKTKKNHSDFVTIVCWRKGKPHLWVSQPNRKPSGYLSKGHLKRIRLDDLWRLQKGLHQIELFLLFVQDRKQAE